MSATIKFLSEPPSSPTLWAQGAQSYSTDTQRESTSPTSRTQGTAHQSSNLQQLTSLIDLLSQAHAQTHTKQVWPYGIAPLATQTTNATILNTAFYLGHSLTQTQSNARQHLRIKGVQPQHEGQALVTTFHLRVRQHLHLSTIALQFPTHLASHRHLTHIRTVRDTGTVASEMSSRRHPVAPVVLALQDPGYWFLPTT